MGVVRNAFNAAWPDGPSSSPFHPVKSEIRALGSVIEGEIAGAASGYIIGTSWLDLSTNPDKVGSRDGAPGRIPTTVTGTHTGYYVNSSGSVVSGTVPDAGEYLWSESLSAWVRTGDTIDVSNITIRLDELDERSDNLEAQAARFLAFSHPIIADWYGQFGPERTIYVSRYMTARLGGVTLSAGPYNSASSFDADYAAFTLPNDLSQIFYLDFADATNPIKVVAASSSAPVRDRPEDILIFATARQRMVNSEIPVINVTEQWGERLVFQRALVVDAGKLLVPSFYHYSRVTGFTYYSPTGSFPTTGERYWEVPISSSFVNETRVYFDRLAVGASRIKVVTSTDQPAFPAGGGLIPIAWTLRGYVHSEFALAGDVPGGKLPNLFTHALDAYSSVLYSTAALPADVTNSDAVALGITTGVRGTGSYYGEELPKNTPKRGFYFARVYIVSDADDVEVTPRMHIMDSGQSIIHSTDLTLEKIISARLRMYTVDAPYNLSEEPVSYTVGLSQDPVAVTVCGAQVYIGGRMTGAILRDDYVRPVQPEPLYGRRHFAIAGRELPILKASLLAERDAPQDVEVSLWRNPASNSDAPWRALERGGGLVVDEGGDFNISTMANNGTRVKRRYSRAIEDIRIGSVAADSPKIMGIGDSITNRNILTLLKAKLENLGKTPTFMGTMNNREELSDPAVLGEGRGTWRAADFYYQFTTRLAVEAGDEAAYLALSPENAVSGGRWDRNPFVRTSTGGDPSGNVFNGKIFDFGFYLSRFSFADPDFVVIGLGTNDINTHTPASSLLFVERAMNIMVPSIRAACPDAHIAWWLPTLPRIASGDVKWREEQVQAIRAMLNFEQTLADDKFSILSTWAHMDTIAGWSTQAENSIAAANGMATTVVNDELHPIGFNRHVISELMAAWICASGAEGPETTEYLLTGSFED